MANAHLTPQLLAALDRGELSPHVLLELLTIHVAAVCPTCRTAVQSWQRTRRPVRPQPASQAVSRQADGDFRRLMRMTRAERAAKIARANSRYRSSALVDRLLAECRAEMIRKPQQALELAEAAALVLERSYDLGRLVLAHALAANACRLLADFRAAGRRFESARAFLVSVADLAVWAEVDGLEGSLASDLRDFGRAAELLSRSITLWSFIDERRAARPLVSLAITYYRRGGTGDYNRAIALSRRAADLIDEAAEPFLALAVRHNVALYLTEAGQPREAARYLAPLLPRYRDHPEQYLQLRWLEGRIKVGLGDAGAAEQAFRYVRDQYLKDAPYDAALVSLDLALLYLRQRRTAELRQLIHGVLPIFQAHGIEREALAALRLLAEAPPDGPQQLEALKVRLRSARSRPKRPFTPEDA